LRAATEPPGADLREFREKLEVKGAIGKTGEQVVMRHPPIIVL
jgi:hypothetical protein